jgi:hypothetical protein
MHKDNWYNAECIVEDTAMKDGYFETLHRDEARRAEWRLLDCALANRTADRTWLQRWRVALGHTMIGLGTRLAGEHAISDDCAIHPCR